MILIDTQTSEELEAVIEKAESSDLKKLKNNKAFTFDWSKEIGKEVYKIHLKDKKEILGLVAIQDVKQECRLHIDLIEAGKGYRGKQKKLKNIPGCLIAFVCAIAFEKGYDGFVSLKPKTKLKNYYRQTYGFIEIGIQMAVFDNISKLIISKYIDNEKI